MKENQKLSVLTKLAVGLAAAFLVLCAVLVYVYVTPLAAPMALDTTGPSEPLSSAPLSSVPLSSAPLSSAPLSSAPRSVDESPARPAAQKSDTVCGNTGSLLILFTGEDFNQGVPPLGADTVRLAKIDFTNRQIVVVGFPRDLWVQTPALAPLNYPGTRLGLSYHYKKEATQGSDKHKVTTATAQVAQALYDNFGLQPQKYFTIQLQNTPAMIDAIGGIDVDVPEAFTSQYGVAFAAGPQHMDGAAAAEYVRSYTEDDEAGDLLRFPRQNILIQALQDQMLSAGIITKVPELYKQFDKAIVTDLSPKQIADLACMAKEVPQSAIQFHEITPPTLATESDDLVLTPNIDAIKAALIDWLDL